MIHCPPLPAVVNAGKGGQNPPSVFSETRAASVCWGIQKAAGKKPPEDAIRSIARAYFRFAREQPQIFSLTLMPSTTETEADAAHVQSWRLCWDTVLASTVKKEPQRKQLHYGRFRHGMTALEATRVLPARIFVTGNRHARHHHVIGAKTERHMPQRIDRP